MKSKGPFLTLLIMVLIWGLGYPINKIGLSYTSPTNFVELRFLIATIAMFIIVMLSKNLVLPTRRDLPIILVVPFFQIALTMNLANYGLSLVSPGRATFLVFCTSIWIIPLSVVIHKRINKYDCLALFFGIVGVLVLISPWNIDWKQRDVWIGDISLLLASMFWSIGILCARFMKWHRPSIQLLPWQLLFATLLTVAFAYSQGIGIMPPTLNLTFINSLLFTGILSISIGYWAMIYVSKYVKPSWVSLGLLCVPVISLIVSYLFMNEEISLSFIISIVLISVGVLFHIYSERNDIKHIQLYEKL